MDQDRYSPRQVANICKESLRAVNRWLRTNKLQSVHADDDSIWVERTELRRYMLSSGMDMSRLPATEAAIAEAKAEAERPLPPPDPELVAAAKRIKALEILVRELRSKLFFRDGWRPADNHLISEATRARIEAENIAAKQRWDNETTRQLAAIASIKVQKQ